MPRNLPRTNPEGQGLIQLDLVDERVAWFGQVGSPALVLAERFEVSTSMNPGFLFASLSLLVPPPGTFIPSLSPGGCLSVTLSLQNQGDTKWIAGPPGIRGSVCIGVVVCDEAGGVLVRDHERFELPNDMNPAERTDLTFICHAPEEPGRYQLRFDLVDEGISWFESFGVQAVGFAIEVAAP